MTKPLFKTTDEQKAERSKFQWKESELDDDKYYTLSLLGIINGILPKIGWLLVLTLDHKDNIIGRKFIKR